jgi:hypothetical protein
LQYKKAANKGGPRYNSLPLEMKLKHQKLLTGMTNLPGLKVFGTVDSTAEDCEGGEMLSVWTT